MSDISSNPKRESPLADGEWAGWTLIADEDPWEDHSGPLYFRSDGNGGLICAMRVEKRHTNGSGAVHGGFLLTLADVSLFIISRHARVSDRAVTVSLNSDFAGPAIEGDLLVASGEVVRAGRSLIFVRGLIRSETQTVLTFSGVIKQIR